MLCNCWSGCVPPGSSTSTPHPGDRARWARPGTPRARGTPAPTPPDGTPPGFERTVESELYGTVTVRAWTGLHQKLGSTGRWASSRRDKQLPIVRGTVLQVVVDHLPDGRKPPKDLWLWHAGPVPADPGSALEGLPAPLRPRALPPLRQVLSSPWPAHTLSFSGHHRPVGVAGPGCVRPATSRPPPRGRPAPPLAPTARPGQAPQSLQGPARLPADSAHESAHPPTRPNPRAPAPATRKARRTARNPGDRPTTRANRPPANTKSDNRSLNRKLRRSGTSNQPRDSRADESRGQ